MNAIHVCREIGLLDECMLIEKAGEGVSCTVIPMEAQLEADESASEIQDHRLIVSQNVSYEIESVPTKVKIAVTGEALDLLQNKLSSPVMDFLFEKTCIFSRTNPDQKSWIVERLISMGKTVGMCGDGKITLFGKSTIFIMHITHIFFG